MDRFHNIELRIKEAWPKPKMVEKIKKTLCRVFLEKMKKQQKEKN